MTDLVQTAFEHTVRGTANVIKQMEVALGLLTDHSYGHFARLAWEASRFEVHGVLKEAFCGTYRAQNAYAESARMAVPERVRIAVRLISNALSYGLLFAPRGRKYLVYGHARRKLSPNGYYEDIYTDPLVVLLGRSDCVIVEKPFQWTHRKPTAHPVWNAELQILVSELLSPFVQTRRRKDLKALAQDVRQYLFHATGHSFDFHELFATALSSLIRTRFSFRQLLRWLKPQTVFLVVSYGKEGHILACRDLRIPVVELQHGVITNEHLGYSVPKNHTKVTFPDNLWLFGSYWKNSVDLPLPDDRLKVVGFPYFQRELATLNHCERLRQVVFISQGTIGEKLSEFAATLSAKFKGSWEFLYKLHPGEVPHWRCRYPLLQKTQRDGLIHVIEADSPSLYQLLATSSWQIGVNSTAIFEGLGLGCPAILVDLPGMEYMESLIDSGFVFVARDPDDVELDRLVKLPDASVFFHPRWRENVRELIDGEVHEFCQSRLKKQ